MMRNSQFPDDRTFLPVGASLFHPVDDGYELVASFGHCRVLVKYILMYVQSLLRHVQKCFAEWASYLHTSPKELIKSAISAVTLSGYLHRRGDYLE